MVREGLSSQHQGQNHLPWDGTGHLSLKPRAKENFTLETASAFFSMCFLCAVGCGTCLRVLRHTSQRWQLESCSSEGQPKGNQCQVIVLHSYQKKDGTCKRKGFFKRRGPRILGKKRKQHFCHVNSLHFTSRCLGSNKVEKKNASMANDFHYTVRQSASLSFVILLRICGSQMGYNAKNR